MEQKGKGEREQGKKQKQKQKYDLDKARQKQQDIMKENPSWFSSLALTLLETTLNPSSISSSAKSSQKVNGKEKEEL